MLWCAVLVKWMLPLFLKGVFHSISCFHISLSARVWVSMVFMESKDTHPDETMYPLSNYDNVNCASNWINRSIYRHTRKLLYRRQVALYRCEIGPILDWTSPLWLPFELPRSQVCAAIQMEVVFGGVFRSEERLSLEIYRVRTLCK